MSSPTKKYIKFNGGVCMKVTIHNQPDNLAEKMAKKIIELIEYRENVKIKYTLKEKEN